MALERGGPTRRDPLMGLQRLTYRYVGPAPDEEVLEAGRPIEPPGRSEPITRTSGRESIHERILWLPDRADVEVRLDGRAVRIRPEAPRRGRRPHTVRASRVAGIRLAAWRPPAAAVAGRDPDALGDTLVRLHARTIGAVRYRDAWVVMDRIHDADDNGERLFEYLRDVRPDVNAWFVLEAGSARTGGARASRGHAPRRARVHGVAIVDAQRPVAPVARRRRPILRPADVLRIGGRAGRKFGFLRQPGAEPGDATLRFHGPELDLVIVGSQAEYDAIVSDGSPYLLTAKEVRLTGLPAADADPDACDRVVAAIEELSRPWAAG